MMACICVGAGGFIGALLRYLASGIISSDGFPFATLLINFTGSLLIGAVIAVSEKTCANSNAILFFKTGLCGGFTTFSTFSSEVLDLFEKKQYLTGGGYAIGSVVVCVFGVLLGKVIVNLIIK